VKIYLATWLSERAQGEALTKCEESRRLTSFYFLKAQNISLSDFQQYVNTGKGAENG